MSAFDPRMCARSRNTFAASSARLPEAMATAAAAFLAPASGVAAGHSLLPLELSSSAPPAALHQIRASRAAAAGEHQRQQQLGAAPCAALFAGIGALVGASTARRRQRADAVERRAMDYGSQYNQDDWTKRVKFIEGERAIFEVTIPKPLGLIPKNFPNRPGVGVAKINEDGNTDKLNRSVIIDGAPGMWVLEGDEVVGVNGVDMEGKSLDDIGPLVKESPGDSVTLKLCRYYFAGPVKVVFLPSNKTAVMKRGVEISKAADAGVQEVAYSCKEGWCKACWHTDPMFKIVYRACNAVSLKRPPPKNPRTIPEKWNNVVPLWLIGRRDAMKLAKEAAKREKEEA